MKHFVKFMTKIPENYLPRIEQSIIRAVQVLSDPTSTSESYDAIARDLAELRKNVGKGATEAWQGEVAERLKADWTEAGLYGIELEQQVTPKMTHVMKTAEKLRKAAQSSLWATAAKVVLGLAAITLVGVQILIAPWAEKGTSQSSQYNSEVRQMQQPQKIPYFPEEVRQSSPEEMQQSPPEQAADNSLEQLRDPNSFWDNQSEDDLAAFRAKMAELKKLPPGPMAVTPVIKPAPKPPAAEPPAPDPPVLQDRNNISPPSNRVGCFMQPNPFGAPYRVCPQD
jgi:hypothetical protein